MNPLTKKLMIAAGAVVVCGVIISSIAVSMGALDQRKKGNQKYMEKTYTYSAAELKSVDVSDVSSDVIIKGGSENEIKIVCYESEDDYYKTGLSSDGRLSVSRVVNKSRIGFFLIDTITRKSTLTVYLPSSISGDMKASSVSGGVSLSNITLGGSLEAKTTSGGIQLGSVSAKGRSQISSVSGSAAIDNVSFDALEINSTSGGLRISGAKLTGNLSAINTSGYTELENITSGDVSISSVSGGIKLTAVKGVNFTIKTTSGAITGYISGNPADYRIDASSTSGKIQLPRSQGGANLLKVSSVSSSIDLDIK